MTRMNWADHSHTRTPIRRWSHWFAAIVWLLFASGFSWTRSNSSAPAFVSIVNAYHSLPALTANEPNTLCNDIHCLHGTCRKGECICERGWKGKLCHICGGRVRLDQTSGFISDGKKNYTADQQCTWLIDARHHGNASLIRLKFIEFETECNWDHLYVFKGDSMFAPLVAAFSGVLARRSSPQSDFKLPDIEIEGGLAYLYFYSDTAYFMSGFNLSYQVNRCSSTGKCFDRENDASAIFANEDALDSEYDSNACSADTWHTNHSNCNCNDGLNSLRCFHQFCPNKCSLHGHCDSQSRTCVCNDGFAGADCGQIKLEGYWEAFNWMKRQPILGRALHQAAVDRNQMYVAGGEFFETAAASKQFLMRFDFDAQSWHNVSNSFHQQMHRFGHTLIAYDHHLYMFGGLNPDGVILNELWNFSTVNQQWTLMPTKPDVASNCLVKLCAPLAVAGHTATLVGNRMYVIFGYNPRFGYLNTVQEFRFDILKWSIVSVTGALVKGGFGHSSAYHPDSQTIYVYGGHHSAGSDSVLVDHLYGFNLPDSKWILLTPSQSPRYFHSASVINDQMYVYGGNAHNATQDHVGSQCFSTQFLVYNIPCDSWHFLSEPSDVILNNMGTGRFGHTSVVHRNKMYVFGGFNGVMLNTMFKYYPANCSSVRAKPDCFKMRFSLNCVWNDDLKMCESSTFSGLVLTTMSPFSLSSNISASSMKHKCPFKHVNYKELCEKQTNCPSCLQNTYGCVWCEDSCQHEKCKKIEKQAIQTATQCDANDFNTLAFNCDKFHNCYSCHTDNYCTWQTEQKCKQYVYKFGNKTQKAIGHDTLRVYCEPLCHTYTSCENCTLNQCMWCSSLNRCIESNAYAAIYPLAQCMEWTIRTDKCSNMTCHLINSCERCQQNPRCGWCDDGSGTGVGQCMRGSNTGPMNERFVGHRQNASTTSLISNTFFGKSNLLESMNLAKLEDSRNLLMNYLDKSAKMDDGLRIEQCSADRWHFTTCPSCQCNGHSRCTATSNSTVCEKPCKDLTEGDHCDKCRDGYYGNPVNGRSCIECHCNNHSDTCNIQTGRCFCNTKGIIGQHCEKCDETNFYHGNPIRSTCFYNLSIDFQYTFNMSKNEDRHYKHINFMNIPPKPDVDVDFTISCSVTAYFNISIGSNTFPIRTLHENHLCTTTRFRFSHDEQLFGIENTSFYVYVSSFTFPLLLQISFSQHRTLDLLQFFVTFSSCFLTLLVIAAVLWKIKQKYEMYRRRQQLFLELEHLASRPFSAIIVYLPDSGQRINAESGDQTDGNTGLDKSATGDFPPSSFMSTKAIESNGKTCNRIVQKADNPTPIALEPCHRNRAAVLSLILRLPTGGSGQVPIGQTGIAIASALVSLGPGAQKMSKSNGNNRKGTSHISSNDNNSPVFL